MTQIDDANELNKILMTSCLQVMKIAHQISFKFFLIFKHDLKLKNHHGLQYNVHVALY